MPGPTRYQRVNTATDYALVDDNGVPFPLFLKANGTSTAMQTNSIDFTATDKMTVWAGVRKLMDSTYPVLAELSSNWAAYDGAFGLFGGQGSGYHFGSRGTSNSSVITTIPTAPVTNVLTGIGKISATSEATLRVNGVQAATSSSSQGTGNYGNYPLYLFSRAGTSLFFNGNCYGLVVRGAQSTALEIAAAEDWMEAKTFGKNMEWVYSDPVTTALGEVITTASGEPIYMTVAYQ